MPRRWDITELKPGEEPRTLANELAVHFSTITNIGKPLTEGDIPRSNNGSGMIPQMEEDQIEKMLRAYKKTNSRVEGDIPKDLVNPNAKKLAEVLTPIYNACFLYKTWPKAWKIETIVPIPKTQSPGSMDDIRPISMTTLWSKLLETLAAQFTLQETKNNWNNDQFGGRKGSSTEHVLISIWDKILSGLDTLNGKAVVLAAVDFSKSFSRCQFQQILKAYQKLGLSDWGIAMHAAFLSGREMRIKIGNILSDPHPVTGGAVQGSVLGVMDHNAVLEYIDEEIEDQKFYKYIDDLTLEEKIEKDIRTLVDNDSEPPTHYFKPPRTQETLEAISEKCNELGLKINEKKTQLLTVSNAKNSNNAWITLKDGSAMYSSETMKFTRIHI